MPHPPLGRRARKKEATRRQIVDVALALFERQGFAATTMEQIATAADVAKGTLYNYFPAKEAIICAHWQRVVADYQPQATASMQQASNTRARLKALFRGGLSYVRAHRDSYRIYLHYRLSHAADASGESSGRRV